ncbi:Druantia anti-phage system protein DruA [Leifsonia aquatica]|uniref:Druantia anti-phage system protein DruA n=1 Tax=Leifsonia aquatica TaxID=144185 RepID=UPI0028A7333F|nr:Druantia anti-phage system protein DruA [Leifsonia aquatica]
MTVEKPGDESRPAISHAPQDEHYFHELRERVLDELSVVQGRIALAAHLESQDAKEQLRLAHTAQRAARLEDAAEWLSRHEASLLEHFADGDEVDPARIQPVLTPVRTPLDADLFRFATLQWSVPVSSGYGRRSRFLVRDRQNGKLIAIFALGDPVIAQASRDATIGWNTAQRNKRLYNVYDAFILGAVEPYRQLLAGKLVALLALSNETRDFLVQKYSGSTTGIRGEQKDPTPVLITTSSALGRSSIYNRLTFEGNLMFQSVGFTKGFGHFQFSDELFSELLDFVRTHVLEERGAKAAASAYGNGPNWRFRIIRNALKALDIPEDSLQHNVKREVFLAPTASNWDRFLRGEVSDVELFDLPVDRIGAYYRDRWAIGRAERRPGFALWKKEEGRLTPLLAASRTTRGLPTRSPHGRVDLGAYSLAVGIGKSRIRGTTPGGKNSEGVAYFSRLEGSEVMLTIADIEWDNGEREVRGWDRHDSPPEYQTLVGRLRMGIHVAERFRAMSMSELRLVRIGDGEATPQLHKTSVEELSAMLGIDVVTALDDVAEAMVGTRETLLKDEGARRRQLAVVFESRDRVTPALAWALTRAIPFKLQTGHDQQIPSAPTLARKPPSIDDLFFDAPGSAGA